ncbi:sensor histidine kinase [Roseococcus sp. DSY-14]|uniref:sensor histidine kinase n=1 Tax=Roseococcus sp. DSY-14 TaxID=3369650 RepID=UPI00387B0323
MNIVRSTENTKLQRELDYYRRECNDLGARLLRLQEEQSQAFREARRSRTVAKLIREAHRVADGCATREALSAAMLAVIAENTLCDRAAFALRDPETDMFRVTHAIGFAGEPPAGPFHVPNPPPFFFTTSRTAFEAPAFELTSMLGFPFVLWSFDRASGHALIVGNRTEANVSRPFEPGDQELIEGALSVYIDVLMRRGAELEMLAAKAAADEASAVRTRFIATLSHELRTPLNAIIGFSDMLERRGHFRLTPAQEDQYARQIHESGQTLLELINSILDYSSLASIGPTLTLAWRPARQVAREAVDRMVAMAIQAQVTLAAAAAEPGLELQVDPLRFGQVLGNLLGNAVKFTPPGGSVTLTIAALPDGGAVAEVADTGIGMRPEDVPRALEPFQQVDGGYARAFPGTGLGLPIAKGLAEAHGGSLAIETAPGEGTRVRILLPPEAVRRAR